MWAQVVQESPLNRASQLRSALRGLNALSADIEASAVISGDGLMLASMLDPHIDADRYAAMCASLLALAERAAQEVYRGRLKRVMIEGEHGTMLLVQAGDDGVLAVAARQTVNLGMVFLEATKVAARIRALLDQPD